MAKAFITEWFLGVATAADFPVGVTPAGDASPTFPLAACRDLCRGRCAGMIGAFETIAKK
jgi:hypothetical protein